jgi:uncharacterized protein (DUF1330 family)
MQTAKAALGLTILGLSLIPRPSIAQSADISAIPGYLVVVGRSMDREKLAKYSAALPSIYAETGGQYIGFGRPGSGVTCYYGPCEGRSAVIAYWANHTGVQSFWWGEHYRDAVRLRDQAGAFTVVGLKGVSHTKPFPSGALLLATFGGSTQSTLVQKWLGVAAQRKAVLLTEVNPASVAPLEGDSRVVLLSFSSKSERNAFVADKSTKAVVNKAQSLSLLSLIAVDAPALR